MRGDHRRARDVDRIRHGVIGDMADIDHHAQIVHPRNQRAAQFRETAAWMVARRGMPKDVVIRPRERDVANAQARRFLKPRKEHIGLRLTERMRAFDAHQHRCAALTIRRAHLLRRRCQHDLVGMRLDECAHRRNQRLRTRPSFLAGIATRVDPDAHEHRTQAALAHADQIHVSIGQTRREISVLIEKALRRIGVRIDRYKRRKALDGWRHFGGRFDRRYLGNRCDNLRRCDHDLGRLRRRTRCARCRAASREQRTQPRASCQPATCAH